MTPPKRKNYLLALALVVLVAIANAGPIRAFTYVSDANGTWWGIQDAASPGVDTGSIRGTQVGPGQSAEFSTSINGFGGIKVLVQVTPEPRFNGEIMRGYGLTFNGTNLFTPTQSLDLGGVRISRSIAIWSRKRCEFGHVARN